MGTGAPTVNHGFGLYRQKLDWLLQRGLITPVMLRPLLCSRAWVASVAFSQGPASVKSSQGGADASDHEYIFAEFFFENALAAAADTASPDSEKSASGQEQEQPVDEELRRRLSELTGERSVSST